MNKKILYSVYKTNPEWDTDCDHYGPAVTTSFEVNGVIYVTNGEYISQVNYCPFTGKKGVVVSKPKWDDVFYSQDNFWEWT